MVTLINTYGVSIVVIILLVAIPALVNFIQWCKNLWAKRQEFQSANIQMGRQMEAAEEQNEARLTNGEQRMSQLETDVSELKAIAERQAQLIELLTKSDELDIKSWIKAQHEKWIIKGCIDSQMLDLLEQRYAIYTAEGGNSWAKKLMDELRALPTVTVVSLSDIHSEQ